MAFPVSMKQVVQRTRAIWSSPRISQVSAAVLCWPQTPYPGTVGLLVGTVLATLFFLIVNRTVVSLPNPALIYMSSRSQRALYERGCCSEGARDSHRALGQPRHPIPSYTPR